VKNEVNSLTLALVARITELGERYKETAASITAELSVLAAKVAANLAAMGVK
jgi:type I restriction enzyme M protein